MKKNKILVSILNEKDVYNYKKIGITNFLFALEEFSVGYPGFNLDFIKKVEGNIYLNINRIMDARAINNFKKIINELEFVKGVFFDDLGVYQVLKDTKIPLIWNQTHFVTNSKSVNFWLDRAESAALSNELTLEEIKTILNEASKPIVLNVFGLNRAMMSRRLLLSSFEAIKDVKIDKEVILKINDSNSFLTFENEYGTVLYYNDFFNYIPKLNEFPDNKIKLYYINTLNSEFSEIEKFINGEYTLGNNRFLETKTIYKLED